MTSILKIPLLVLLRALMRIFWVLPIKRNRFMFVSYNGSQYACNPKCFFEYLLDVNFAFEPVWVLERSVQAPDRLKSCIIVYPYTLKYLFYAMTSGVVITNDGLSSYLPFRKKQLLINTWHAGGVYKSSGLAAVANPTKYELYSLKLMAKNLTSFLSSSGSFSKNMSSFYLIPDEKIISIGMPRNDIFFSEFDVEKSRVEFRSEFSIKKEYLTVAYTPTFRGADCEKASPKVNIDIEALLNALRARFGKPFIFMYRLHHASRIEKGAFNGLDLSNYPDCQKLLCAADVLVSDYSSILWDFSLTGKPCFIFAPDVDSYSEINGGFSSSVSSWPFPLATTTLELQNNIISFDETEFNKKLFDHHQELNIFENGTACKSLREFIVRNNLS